MTELDTQKLHDYMVKFKSKAPAPPQKLISKSGLMEYLKSEEFKQRVKKAKEEYQRKKNP